ncbi:glycosyltransferase [Agromyces sp. NPDC058136]|uniref:glycosyltransferase n=1 Tax=Agromyces sp. NPDC058136 TaxID=3346354 RepID=UPI0036DABBC3
MTRVVAIVPTFHPEADVVPRLAALRTQVDRLLVVDDGSGPSAVLDTLEGVADRVVRSRENTGIAAALNAGMRLALESDAEYVLTVDQDTDLPPGYVRTALDLFARANPVTRLGMVVVDGVNGHPAIPPSQSPEGFGLVPEAIQTGSLIHVEVLREAGLLDERLFIDCVDTEYCLRVREAGFRIAVASGTDIAHSIGRRAPLRPFGIALRHDDGRVATYQYHSPFRRYYIARNNIDLLLRYGPRQPRWAYRVVRRETGGMIVSMVSGPQRLKQVLAITTGTVHGVVRRRGRMPAWLSRAVR